MSLSKEEASKQIAEKLDQAQKLLHEAEALADEAGVEFSWKPFYGGGGTYFGKDSRDDWQDSNGEWETSDYYETGWQSSSHNC